MKSEAIDLAPGDFAHRYAAGHRHRESVHRQTDRNANQRKNIHGKVMPLILKEHEPNKCNSEQILWFEGALGTLSLSNRFTGLQLEWPLSTVCKNALFLDPLHCGMIGLSNYFAWQELYKLTLVNGILRLLIIKH